MAWMGEPGVWLAVMQLSCRAAAAGAWLGLGLLPAQANHRRCRARDALGARQPILLEALYISLRASWNKASSIRHGHELTLKIDWMLL